MQEKEGYWHCLGHATTPGLNPTQVDHELLPGLLAQLLAMAGAQLPQVYRAHGVAWYGAGCGGAEPRQRMHEAWKDLLLQHEPYLYIGTDLALLARILGSDVQAVVAIMGTGSSAALVHQGKVIQQAPSAGFWDGDYGSGAWLGKQLLIHWDEESLPKELRSPVAQVLGRHQVPAGTSALAWLADQPKPQAAAGGVVVSLLETLALTNLLSIPWASGLITEGIRTFLAQEVVPLTTKAGLREVYLVGTVAVAHQSVVEQELQALGLRLAGPVMVSAAAHLQQHGLKVAVRK
jgi:hypothetical protein